MAMYNSKNDEVDEHDYTMIAATFPYGIDDPYYQPRLPQTRQQSTDKSSNAESSLPEWIQDFEQILYFYRSELQPESNSQAHVHHQFLLRLIDLIRPHYHQNQQKLEQFDRLFQDIIALYERETVKQRESMKELKEETAHWQNVSFVSMHEPAARPNATVVNEDLIELRQSMEHLHGILEAQRSRINELTELISAQPAAPKGPKFDEVPYHPPVRATEALFPPVDKGTFDPSRGELRHLSQQISAARDRRCMICQTKFLPETSENDIVQHLIVCTDQSARNASSHRPEEKHRYICPNCKKKLDVRDDQAYLKHLTDCYEAHIY